MGLDNILVVHGGMHVYVICGCLLFLGDIRKKSIQESPIDYFSRTTYHFLPILQFWIAIHKSLLMDQLSHGHLINER